MLILFLASLSATGYGIYSGNGTVIASGAVGVLIFGLMLRAHLRLRAAVNRDRSRWSTR